MGITLLHFSFLVNFNFEFTYKKPTFIKAAFFSDVILASNHHCFKEEVPVPNKLNTTLFDHKTVKVSHLEK